MSETLSNESPVYPVLDVKADSSDSPATSEKETSSDTDAESNGKAVEPTRSPDKDTAQSQAESETITTELTGKYAAALAAVLAKIPPDRKGKDDTGVLNSGKKSLDLHGIMKNELGDDFPAYAAILKEQCGDGTDLRASMITRDMLEKALAILQQNNLKKDAALRSTESDEAAQHEEDLNYSVKNRPPIRSQRIRELLAHPPVNFGRRLSPLVKKTDNSSPPDRWTLRNPRRNGKS